MTSLVPLILILTIIQGKYALSVSDNNVTSTLANAWTDCQSQGTQLLRPDKADILESNTTIWTGRVAVLSPWIANYGCYSANGHLNEIDSFLCTNTSGGINDCFRCCNETGYNGTGYFALQKHNCYCIKDYVALMRDKVEEIRCWYATKNSFDVERKGGNDLLSLYQKVYDSNETIHHYRRCVAAKCRYFGDRVYDPTDCTRNITGLCSNGALTSSASYMESFSQCFGGNSNLEPLDQSVRSYCRKTKDKNPFWVAYQRYVDILDYNGNLSSLYMCEIAKEENGTFEYIWTSNCRNRSYELSYMCAKDSGSDRLSPNAREAKHSDTAAVAGGVSGVVVVVVFFIVVFAVYCRGYNEREVPRLTRESYSGHSTRVYVKATDDLRPLPPPENGRQENCHTSLKNEATCSSTVNEDGESIYEAYDSDLTDVKPNASTSQTTHYAISNQCYATVGGQDNTAFEDEEEKNILQSYDFVEPSASLRLTPRITESNDPDNLNIDQDKLSRSATLPTSHSGREKTTEKNESTDSAYDPVEPGTSIRLPPRIFDNSTSEDSPNDFEDYDVPKKLERQQPAKAKKEESDEEENIYDTQLANMIFQRQNSQTVDESSNDDTVSSLYKDMNELSRHRRGSYVQMDMDDTYKVIDPHFSIKRK